MPKMYLKHDNAILQHDNFHPYWEKTAKEIQKLFTGHILA